MADTPAQVGRHGDVTCVRAPLTEATWCVRFTGLPFAKIILAAVWIMVPEWLEQVVLGISDRAGQVRDATSLVRMVILYIERDLVR